MMKLTRLVLAVTAIAALTAFAGASAASAAQYKSSSSPVEITGTQNSNHVWTIDGQTATCTGATFSKKGLATPANEVPGVVASYTNCTAFGFAGSVNMGSCTYNLDTPNAGLTSNFDIGCTNIESNKGTPVSNTGDIVIIMMVFTAECEVHIGINNNKGTLTFVNNNPLSGDVLVKIAATGLTASTGVDNGLCPLNGVGTVNNASYSGQIGLSGPAGVNLEVG